MKNIEKREKIKALFKRYLTLAEISKELKISRQRVKVILDEVMSKREQKFIKAMRSNKKSYRRRLKEIKRNYGEFITKEGKTNDEI